MISSHVGQYYTNNKSEKVISWRVLCLFAHKRQFTIRPFLKEIIYQYNTHKIMDIQFKYPKLLEIHYSLLIYDHFYDELPVIIFKLKIKTYIFISLWIWNWIIKIENDLEVETGIWVYKSPSWWKEYLKLPEINNRRICVFEINSHKIMLQILLQNSSNNRLIKL